MRRVRIGIIGAGAFCEWGILPTLQGTELLSPPDLGAWWNRRPVERAEIRWQAPFRPEVVALCEEDEEQRRRIATNYRLATTYADATTMLRECKVDAIFCEEATHESLTDLITQMAHNGAKCLWLGGAPARTPEEALELAHWAGAHDVQLWSGRTLRYAAAHRAATRIVSRGEIGDVTALALRWSTPFATEVSTELRSTTFEALDLLLACVGTAPQSALLSEAKGTAHLWLSFAGGSAATAIFSSADNWNAALPRLEICGTQGRYLLCEGGRRVGFFRPHEATRWIEPPALANHVSSANLGGLAENIKLFLASCVAERNSTERTDWLEVARVLEVMRAARESLPTATPVPLRQLHLGVAPTAPITASTTEPKLARTLPLALS